ncbi:tRNA (adenosine(37)-N6)-threonylcarbamoyltransferase complex dimerization subunit type 1 TsaB [Polyangium aurulentum]|uniref:tRNA (adenosine(37)-N6)-threonylcarbamoyltransferase complex dimerization subunit type 1 TsaB n=1 Tax=Polyangium aurulentum TaxID=2567896 RepID=UPI0010ADA9F8|nr:tRNA (adenosine(37)-N6)-threonylcarbamoyltransferase complex dimerization subunit type 1 TsaB [Polyangium aurulentum]UQA60002.1 tRNA (adenosine(37)-N6)-threonylcarbamoyltransferase complex dimerization subunit type 1 TsaB [Polyangium aurulentum]
MRLLAISTSTPRGSAAVLDASGILGISTYADLEGHAERIFLAVDEALAAAGVTRGELTAFACDVGPGSFTGVRVGVAAAKGMALGRGAPLAGAGSLESMAFAAFASGAAGPDDLVIAALDAKKNELFLGGYDAALTPVLAPLHVPIGEAAAVVLRAAVKPGGTLRVVGEVAASVEGLAPLVLRGAAFDLPDAAAIGRVALGRIGVGSGDPEGVEPVYVRPPDAKPMAT